ncbi:ABC transporter permease [Geodermatophilus sabuli]|uniref:ABC transporter permease n=1 Tax=Geodermatophilus sabuli TaxID=1564158 RepID=A0A7K3VZ10_9ACTN|nr:ABC transporter permease [Geodermatophilus sabuli]NEK57620.1 ABC transporter permease [Geodermatophilus sabuli]
MGPRLAAVLVVLAVLAAVVGRLSGLAQDRPVVVAVVRATVQLAVVSAVLLAVVGSLWLSAAFVLLMVVVAAATAAGRATGLPLRAPGAPGRVATAALPVLAGAAPVVALVLVSGAVPLRGEAVIPIAGILIGGAMTATSLAGRRLREELTGRRGEVEAALALGLLRRDAVLEVVRPAAAGALLPALDQTRTVGLVTLPGAFVGVLLGGGSPLEAGAAQLLVLVGLLAAQGTAVWAVTELVAGGHVLPDVPR